jgi:predicted DNA-binding transcriptional regulator AlpA
MHATIDAQLVDAADSKAEKKKKKREKTSTAEMLNTEDAAALVGVSVRTLECWRSAGRGPAYIRVGRRPRPGQKGGGPVRYRRIDVLGWIEAQREAADQA